MSRSSSTTGTLASSTTGGTPEADTGGATSLVRRSLTVPLKPHNESKGGATQRGMGGEAEILSEKLQRCKLEAGRVRSVRNGTVPPCTGRSRTETAAKGDLDKLSLASLTLADRKTQSRISIGGEVKRDKTSPFSQSTSGDIVMASSPVLPHLRQADDCTTGDAHSMQCLESDCSLTPTATGRPSDRETVTGPPPLPSSSPPSQMPTGDNKTVAVCPREYHRGAPSPSPLLVPVQRSAHNEPRSDPAFRALPVQRHTERTERWMRLPYYANLYLQVFLNAFLIAVLCYSAWVFFKGIRNDVHSKVQLYSKDMMEKISLCARHYSENRCDPPSRVPALEKACTDWEVCMNQDSRIVDRRSQLSAQTVGEVINAFLEQLSWKSASLLGVGFVIMVVGSNAALTLSRCTTARQRSSNKNHSLSGHVPVPPPSQSPQTDYHSFSPHYHLPPQPPDCYRYRHTHSLSCLGGHGPWTE